jgi:hypothetical protein
MECKECQAQSEIGQQFNSTIYSPWLDVRKKKKKVKPLFFEYIKKSCIFESESSLKLKKIRNLVEKTHIFWL